MVVSITESTRNQNASTALPSVCVQPLQRIVQKKMPTLKCHPCLAGVLWDRLWQVCEIVAYKTAGTTRAPLPLALPKSAETLTELESIDARACCKISTLYCQFEILTQFKFQIPLALFARLCSVKWNEAKERTEIRMGQCKLRLAMDNDKSTKRGLGRKIENNLIHWT